MENDKIEIHKTFTYQNYVKYQVTKIGPGGKTNVSIRPLLTPYSSPFFEAIEAAKKITFSAGGQVDLLVDSEPRDFCTLEAFVLAKASVHVHIINDDKDVLSKWSLLCQQAGADLTVHRMNPEEWNETIEELKSTYNCTELRQLRLITLLKLVGGNCPVISGSLPRLKKNDGKWEYAFPSEEHLLFLQAFLNQDIQYGAPSFFIWSPELLHSLAKLPIFLNAMHLNEELPANLEKEMLSQAGFSFHELENPGSEIQYTKKLCDRRDFLRGASAAAALLLSSQVMAARSAALSDILLEPASLADSTKYTNMILIAADKHDK